ncbi:MAG: sugar phosphate isomerase/epimerase [Anaerolineae bacterium]
MRIGYCTWGMKDVGIEEAIPAVAEIGYSGIELTVTPGWPTELESLDATRRRRLRELLDQHDLTLTAVASHRSMCEDDEEKNAANMRYLCEAMDLAVEIDRGEGPPIVVSLVGGRPEEWATKRELVAERVYGLGEEAASRGVILAVEPHSGTALDLPDKTEWLLEEVNHPAVRLNFDISHFDVMGLDIDECVSQMAPYAVHTHVKDQRGIYPHHEFLTPGSGPFDFVHYLEAMDAAGYTGFICVEVSVMVQRKKGYDPFVDAHLGYWALRHAFNMSGVPLE